MEYGQLVDKYIKDSGLSLGDIAKRMQDEKGIKIDRSYISKLRNDPKYPASDEINRALAEITGGDPERLVLAAFYQKAPKEAKPSLKFTEHYRQFKKFLLESEFLVDHFKELNIENVSEETKEEAVDAFIDSLSQDSFNEIWRGMLKVTLYENPKEFREIVKVISKEKLDEDKLYQLERMRVEHNLSIEDMAKALSVSNKEYEDIEALGGLLVAKGEQESEKYREALNYLNNLDQKNNTIEFNEFEEFMNNPEHGIFFKDYLSAPEERREEMRQIFKILMEKEKDRKPGDRQGE
ncbi:hypothetical protein QYF50_15380 [Paenibacillus vini]|uniref:hypothetical protein n=1 Tax=Paenibacillus vini TaxID=1476024 RepID=UPI0025B711EB|nr:hypothetical protein [Paenibacillus vini]MDN4069233.1 hypothetical protein [Paenibacillus vini]MDN4069286.1 hypothetical protein [Paenibacillus vini]